MAKLKHILEQEFNQLPVKLLCERAIERAKKENGKLSAEEIEKFNLSSGNIVRKSLLR